LLYLALWIGVWFRSKTWETETVRKLFVLLSSALIVFGMTGTAAAAPLNWEGTNTLLLGDFPRSRNVQGGGVATINSSAGTGHIETLRLKASRGNVRGDFTQLVTDPETVGNNIASIQYENILATTGTFAPISGALESAGRDRYGAPLPVHHRLRR
jgi:hypothetical protein